jgi:iron complex outermembrane receptor protein
MQAVAVLLLGLMTASAAMAVSTANPSTRPATTDNITGSPAGANEFGNLSIEELLNVEVRTPAGLTATDVRHLPVDVTVLDARDIQESGAKNLDQLLEDYVPNAQIMDHNAPEVDVGFRGIISDREDKYLYQVNGITMNNRMLFGANNEREQPLMGDINTVDVVEGPASATYGSGAIAGVIDVQPYTGLTFQGADVTVRQGVVDQYTSSELRYGRRLSDTSGLFTYFGFAQVKGADSPLYFGHSYPAKNGLPAYTPGEPFSGGPISNVGESAFDAPWYRAHVDYVDGPWEFWTRFTQDGSDTRPARNIYTSTKSSSTPLDTWLQGRDTKNQQFTTTGSFKKDLSSAWNVELAQSYDIWLSKDQRAGVSVSKPTRSAYENQLFSRAIATWTPVDSQSVAFGTEYSHLWYHDPPTSDQLDNTPVVTTRDWQTDTFSFLAEDQWKISKRWTTFLSVREDKNTYTGWLLSPRATVVFTPTKKDTLKFVAGEAVRRQDDEDIWGQWLRTRTYADPETLKTLELSYERKVTDQWTVGGNGFFEDYDAVGWNPGAQEASSLGHFQIVGGELDLSYRTKTTRFTLSEGVSTLLYASVPAGAPAVSQGISAAPYGFGNDLANWAPSITKIAITHDFTKKWSGSASVVYYSGFPGGQDYANYAATIASPPGGVPLSNPNYSTSYGPNLYLNLGMEYRASEHLTFRLDGYNLAALWDPTLSKRNYILRTSEFSVQPASLAVSVRYRF